MRRLLDGLYAAAGWAAALAILAIAVVVSAQVALNAASRITGNSMTIPSYADFAGFALAAATFLALAPTLRAGVHIRVNLLIRRLGPGAARALELPVLALSAAVTGYATWYAAVILGESWRYGDTSPGMIPVPLWIPQIFMVAGLALLCVALVDSFVEALRSDGPVIDDEEEV